MNHPSTLVTLAEIEAARRRVGPVIHDTPVESARSVSDIAGRSVLFKAEYRQRTGSFKIRGAFNRIVQLPAGVDVIAASAGNHAQGVALAANLTGRRSTIYMPSGAALPKADATRAYGATVRMVGHNLDDAIEAARIEADHCGAVLIPPFDDRDIIAGQGTLGLELADEATDAQVVVVPVGGGGLLAGVAAALAATSPGVRVVGVEAAGAPTLTAALAAGRPVSVESMATMADGIAVGAVSALTLAHVDAFVDEVVTVDEEEISRALLLLVERTKAVVEPAAATALAAILAGRVGGNGQAVAVLSGGNVDPLLLTKLIHHGLAAAGRYLVLRVIIDDRPGALASLTAELAQHGVNVLEVGHHRSDRALDLSEVEVQVTVETRNETQHREIIDALTTSGYRVESRG
ncbi:MAG: threonine ammonia-lyase [Actinomycetota bacterium]|nr:threonine ammonia-lyase [Actinomycetota bacterium]